jgi:hypothetical protein
MYLGPGPWALFATSCKGDMERPSLVPGSPVCCTLRRFELQQFVEKLGPQRLVAQRFVAQHSTIRANSDTALRSSGATSFADATSWLALHDW